MKILAFYLPQFHITPENDKWWGKGFTDWITVKKATPLYSGHKQPRVPLNEWYYDLSETDSLSKQAGLLSKYGVDGLCFYHYYFKGGRSLLTKPAEILLNHKEIQMPFCFSWANEGWVRNWSNIQEDTNSWNDDIWANPNFNETDGILVEQGYGDESDWINHFYYLLPFFKDERYISIDGHPLMIIYKQRDIYCFEDMKICWERLADKENLPSVCFFSTNQINDLYQHRVIQEPQDTIFDGKSIDYTVDGPYILDYNIVWKKLLVKSYGMEDGVCPGGFIGYDDTPRRGRSGVVIENDSPAAFKRYLSVLMKIAEIKHSEFIMLNAWNEWGEGMYLEPDSDNGYAYLQAVLEAKSIFKSVDPHIISEYEAELDKTYDDSALEMIEIREYEKVLISKQRYMNYSEIYRKWLKAKMQGRSIGDYLLRHGYESVAVYGMAALGRMVVMELRDSCVKLKYGIDKKGKQFNLGIPIYKPEDELESVDMVIMCLGIPDPILNRGLKERLGCKVIDMKDLVREI